MQRTNKTALCADGNVVIEVSSDCFPCAYVRSEDATRPDQHGMWQRCPVFLLLLSRANIVGPALDQGTDAEGRSAGGTAVPGVRFGLSAMNSTLCYELSITNCWRVSSVSARRTPPITLCRLPRDSAENTWREFRDGSSGAQRCTPDGSYVYGPHMPT